MELKKELRIGNLVQQNGIIYTICKLSNSDIKGHEGGTSFSLDALARPIPLTEEWLKRMGFGLSSTADKLSNWSDSGPTAILVWDNDSTVIIFRKVIGRDKSLNMPIVDSVTVEIKYVHQLQNLYFALTGKELELREEKIEAVLKKD